MVTDLISESPLWFTVVLGGCFRPAVAMGALLSPVMRFTCGLITKVMMSCIDGEITLADSLYHQTGV